MADGTDRLVRLIHEQWQSSQPDRRLGRVGPHNVAELAARIRRLHATGRRYIHVALSRYVAESAAVDVSRRVGGERVATEV